MRVNVERATKTKDKLGIDLIRREKSLTQSSAMVANHEVGPLPPSVAASLL